MTGLTMMGAGAAACEGDACLIPAPQGVTRDDATATPVASSPDMAPIPGTQASAHAEEAVTPPR